MSHKIGRFLLVLVLGWTLMPRAYATEKVLGTDLTFSKQGEAKVDYQIYDKSPKDIEVSKIQATLIFYAYVMHQLGEDDRKKLMGQVQSFISRLATEQGLVRANLVKDNPLINHQDSEKITKKIHIAFDRDADKQHTLSVDMPDGGDVLKIPAVIFLFQDQVNHLPVNALRLMTLAMGGMNKWYREKGTAADPTSVSQAPSYGLNLAVEIIEKLNLHE